MREGFTVDGGAARVAELIAVECDAVKAMLLEKNKNYGN